MDRMNGYVYFYRSKCQSYNDDIESYFQTADGHKVPVYKNYRNSIKKGWSYFDALNILHYLIINKLATEQNKEFFKACINSRTITKPLNEINDYVLHTSQSHNIFIENNTTSMPIIKPTSKEISNLIDNYTKQHKLMFSKLKTFHCKNLLKKGNTILEIGFVSGGYSIFAFEKLGFSASGIDNCYDGLIGQYKTPFYVKESLNSDVDFVFDDITQRTKYDDETFDIVYSTSVLEHIKDLDKAFIEMYRILKKGGLMIHNYNPFFSPNGGHALGITDAPWGHIRMSHSDYKKYIHETRPNEAELAIDWIDNALNKITINQMQKSLAENNFNIVMWQESAASKFHIDFLNHTILSEVYINYPHVTLSDMISQNIFFAAEK